MEGFFYKEEDKKKTRSIQMPKNEKKQKVKDSCESCGLYRDCITPKMKYTGKGKKKILIIGEAPGKTENEQGTQLIGQAGKTLRKYLNLYNIDLDEDCWKTNAIICRPAKNKTPTLKEINFCRPNLFKTIQELKPDKIITLGKIALQSLIGEKIQATSIEKLVGWKIPDQDLNCWLFPNYHPQYLNYNENDIALKNLFKKNLKKAIEWNKDFPKDETKINYLLSPFEAILFLDSLSVFPTGIAIDIETTGKRYHHPDQKILCMAIATTDYEAFVFPIFNNKSFLLALKRILKNEEIKKIGQNIKFENKWIKNKLKCNVAGWVGDTMIAAHSLDNRTGITGLKFQTYINFGVAGYDKEVDKFIGSKEEFGFNKLERVDQKNLMKYCAKDAIYTYRLFMEQKPIKEIIPGIDLFIEGQKVFSEIEQNGICADQEYYQNIHNRLDRKQKLMFKKIQMCPELKNWEEEFNFNSPKQMNKLLFEDLKYEPIKYTAKGNNSTDIQVLEKINTDFTRKILQHRKLEKLKGTYIKGLIENSYNGKIYPNFNLNLVRSYRSSSDSPNFQNMPKHDKQAQKYIRSGIKPCPGNQLLEVDYSGIEVRISACVHKDPAMIKYINDPESDMHRDIAQQIFIKKEISKQERFLAKNNFVFAQFYGDYYVHCAKNLWENSSKDFLPFTKYSKFENHIKDIEDDFWNNRFKVYKQWKEEIWKEFQKNGYIITHTGFKISGHLKKNDVTNYPIQGPAFHCLLWSLIKLQFHLTYLKYKTKIIGQIHDSILFDLVPKEFDKLKILIRKITCEDIREHWKWIIVPLDIEAEISEIDGNWYNMEGIKI